MEPIVHTVTAAQAGRRLDVILVEHLKLGRKPVKAWIESGAVRLNYQVVKKAALKLQLGDEISWRDLPEVTLSPAVSDSSDSTGEGEAAPAPIRSKNLRIQLRDGRMVPVLFADEHVLVLDKPPGCSVHEGIGHKDDTLSAALERALGPRGKAFHLANRLDRDTSGCIVVARTADALSDLLDQFKSRAVEKTYFALAGGVPEWTTKTIDLPLIIPREELGAFDDPKGEPRKTLVGRASSHNAKDASTDIKVLERFDVPGPVKKISFLEVRPHTGRRHQIRVHLASQGMPLLVDELYGSRRFNWRVLGLTPTGHWPAGHNPISRQPLHAGEVEFVHPFTRAKMTVQSPLPKDMVRLLDLLRKSGVRHGGKSPR
ncbi:MAG TPA: RluA family pseudouridine synthase [Planctomycetota bacterium]|nr:RluA family pseudouridine synthase [Planctomycetota bacterium]